MNKDKACTPIVTFFRKIVRGSVKFRQIVTNNMIRRELIFKSYNDNLHKINCLEIQIKNIFIMSNMIIKLYLMNYKYKIHK